MSAITEWWVVAVDEAGDMSEVEVFPNRREAEKALSLLPEPEPGTILTIEGRRYYGDEFDGVTDVKYKRTGLVRGSARTAEQRHHQTADTKFHRAGEEGNDDAV